MGNGNFWGRYIPRLRNKWDTSWSPDFKTERKIDVSGRKKKNPSFGLFWGKLNIPKKFGSLGDPRLGKNQRNQFDLEDQSSGAFLASEALAGPQTRGFTR